MSRITDIVDAAGHSDVELPSRASFAVAASAQHLERFASLVREDGDLADALARAFEADATIEVVGFSAADAEPFVVGPLPRARAVDVVRERLRRGGAVNANVDPIWGAHRGHAVWLHPASVEAARVALALRIAEVVDPARMLGSHATRLAALATRAVSRVEDLEAALSEASLAALVGSLAELPESDERAPSSMASDESAIVLVHARGDALVARVTGSSAPMGLVDRAGRPFVLPRSAPDLVGWLVLLHGAIDRDAPVAEVLAATEGARVEGDAPAEIIASERASCSSKST